MCITHPLKLCGAPIPIGKWASMCITALMNMWEAPDASPGRAHIMKVITQHVGKLEVNKMVWPLH